MLIQAVIAPRLLALIFSSQTDEQEEKSFPLSTPPSRESQGLHRPDLDEDQQTNQTNSTVAYILGLVPFGVENAFRDIEQGVFCFLDFDFICQMEFWDRGIRKDTRLSRKANRVFVVRSS